MRRPHVVLQCSDTRGKCPGKCVLFYVVHAISLEMPVRFSLRNISFQKYLGFLLLYVFYLAQPPYPLFPLLEPLLLFSLHQFLDCVDVVSVGCSSRIYKCWRTKTEATRSTWRAQTSTKTWHIPTQSLHAAEKESGVCVWTIQTDGSGCSAQTIPTLKNWPCITLYFHLHSLINHY